MHFKVKFVIKHVLVKISVNSAKEDAECVRIPTALV